MTKLVWITDPAHPHYREYGVLVPEDTAMNGMMTLIMLDNCEHGNDSCYVTSRQYEEVSDD